VAFLFRLCGFRLAPLNAKSLDYVVAKEIRKELPLVGPVEPTSDSDYPLPKCHGGDLRSHMAEPAQTLLFLALPFFEKRLCLLAQFRRDLPPREAIFRRHHPEVGLLRVPTHSRRLERSA
jgi:hypothetical protein